MKITPIALFLSFIAAPALAQDASNQDVMGRMDSMEHELQLLQKQVARDPGSVTNTAPSFNEGDGDSAAVSNPAQMEVRLSAIENALRELRGKTEENNFQIKKLSDTLDKMQKDTDFRFNELTPKTATPAATTPTATTADSTKKPLPDNPAPAATTPEKKQTEFATPREHYNYAFRLLNQTQYEDAAEAFAGFTKKYPKDPLIGNAYYWEGETYYIRRDYVNAADDFRQGFEALPNGPKAPDNLLKLAMSLDALNRDKEACVVLGQILTKFKNSSTNVTEKADQERKRIGCQ